ncbi:MAG: hypothetical protein Tsb0019_26480 [Roseibium sp.]
MISVSPILATTSSGSAADRETDPSDRARKETASARAGLRIEIRSMRGPLPIGTVIFLPPIQEGVATLRIPAALTSIEPPLICRAFWLAGRDGIFSAAFIGRRDRAEGNVDSN